MFFHVSFSACQICSRTTHGCLGFRKALYRDMIVIYLLYKTVTYPNHSQEVRQIIFPNKRAILGCGNSCDFPRSQAPGNFPAMERRSWNFRNLSQGKLYRESRKDPTKKRGETPASYSILTLGSVVQIFENIPAETNGTFEYPPWNYHSTWKWMVGILVSLWDGLFSGAMLVLGSVDGFDSWEVFIFELQIIYQPELAVYFLLLKSSMLHHQLLRSTSSVKSI